MSLHRWHELCIDVCSKLEEDVARCFFWQLTEGLEECHSRGIVHRIACSFLAAKYYFYLFIACSFLAAKYAAHGLLGCLRRAAAGDIKPANLLLNCNGKLKAKTCPAVFIGLNFEQLDAR